MKKFSSSFHRRKGRLFLYIGLGLVGFIFCINLILSVAINYKIKQFRKALLASEGFVFDLKLVYFNLFRGLTLRGVEFTKDDELLFAAKRMDIGFDLSSIAHKKILIKNIEIRQSHVSLDNTPQIEALLRVLSMGVDLPIGFFETTHFKGKDIWLGGVALLDTKGYLSSLRNNILVSRGELLLKKIQIPAVPDVDPFRNSRFYETFDYVFEAKLGEEDFVISHLDFSNQSLHFLGSGSVRNYKTSPKVELAINLLNLILDDFPALNDKYMRSRGIIDAVLKVEGALEDIKSILAINISNTQFSFFNSILLKDVNGSLVVTREDVTGEDFSLRINDIPCNADFTFRQEEYPHISVNLSSLSEIQGMPVFVLKASTDWIENSLCGGVEVSVRYSSEGAFNVMDFKLKDFQLNYGDEPFVNADNLGIRFLVDPARRREESQSVEKEFDFSDMSCRLVRKEGSFILEELKASCYSGALEGEVEFWSQASRLNFLGEAHLRGIDLKKFLKKVDKTKEVLLGLLDADLKFDSLSKDLLRGQIFVRDGLIEQNALLNAVADFLGVRSLKKLAFKKLSMFFNGGRGEYASKVELDSDHVRGFLDGKITSYDTLDGYLSVSISTELLNESRQFRKILIYIRHDEPSVIFPFKISSYIDSPRVLWLKNEFKEKLDGLLPESNQRSLQRQVNKMVEHIDQE